MSKYIFYGCVGEEGTRFACESITQSIDQSVYPSISGLLNDCEVIAFSDRAPELWGKQYFGREVIPPQNLKKQIFDKIFILSFMSVDTIFKDLTENHEIPAEKIVRSHIDFANRARERFVRSISEFLQKRGIHGSVAEGGVYQGNFAKVINNCFPDSKLYLFDTFGGLDSKDFDSDVAFSKSENRHTHLADTSVDTVLKKLPYPGKTIIKKGYFPETAENIDDQFIFVNLDFDLYAPIKGGLEFFYPKMKSGGVILVHDYFNSNFDTRKAVDEFCTAKNLFPMPIGDILSVAIVKQ